jgi:hypothetical protein
LIQSQLGLLDLAVLYYPLVPLHLHHPQDLLDLVVLYYPPVPADLVDLNPTPLGLVGPVDLVDLNLYRSVPVDLAALLRLRGLAVLVLLLHQQAQLPRRVL